MNEQSTTSEWPCEHTQFMQLTMVTCTQVDRFTKLPCLRTPSSRTLSLLWHLLPIWFRSHLAAGQFDLNDNDVEILRHVTVNNAKIQSKNFIVGCVCHPIQIETMVFFFFSKYSQLLSNINCTLHYTQEMCIMHYTHSLSSLIHTYCVFIIASLLFL